jgi:hypothetical protein
MIRGGSFRGIAMSTAICLLLVGCEVREGVTTSRRAAGRASGSDISTGSKPRTRIGMLRGHGSSKGNSKGYGSGRREQKMSNNSNGSINHHPKEFSCNMDGNEKKETSETGRVCNICGEGKVTFGLPSEDEEECRFAMCSEYSLPLHLSWCMLMHCMCCVNL